MMLLSGIQFMNFPYFAMTLDLNLSNFCTLKTSGVNMMLLAFLTLWLLLRENRSLFLYSLGRIGFLSSLVTDV